MAVSSFSAPVLSSDTGSSSTDRVTNVANQTVTGTFVGTLDQSTRNIQVSFNNGLTWVNATTSGNTYSAAGTLSGSSNLIVRTVNNGGNPAGPTPISVPYRLDLAAPTLSITLSDADLSLGDTSVVSFTFSEAPTGFTNADVSVDNGALSTIQPTSNPLVFTAVFTPTADFPQDLTNVITVGTGWTDAAGNAPTASFVSPNYIVDTVCFLEGTLIATSDGQCPIEALQVSDLVVTERGLLPVRFISKTVNMPSVLGVAKSLPIRIQAGALGEAGPSRDLFVSPDHAILVEDHLVHASVLVNGSTIVQTEVSAWDSSEPIVYYNVELEAHALISAEGLTVESYVDNVPRKTWDNYSEYLQLYGQELSIRELPLPRIKFARQLPAALRFRLQQLEVLTQQDLVTL